MKRSNFHVFLLMLCFATQLHAQKKLIIAVSDRQGNRLSYPEVMIGADFHRVGSKHGSLEVPLEMIRPNDFLMVKYLGYKPSKILLDNVLLSNGLIDVNLEENSYLLDTLVVRPSGFSAEKYFRQRKKSLLLPYYRQYFFDLNFTPSDSGKPDYSYAGHVSGASRRSMTDIDSTTLMISGAVPDTSKLLVVLKRVSEISYLVADAFCHRRDRKNFYCTYRGKAGDFELWEFDIRKQKKMPWNLQENDGFRCIVSLDKDGFIHRIKSQLTSSSEHSISYLLDTEFGLYKRKLIPLVIKVDFLPNARNEKSQSFSLKIDYSNIRDKK